MIDEIQRNSFVNINQRNVGPLHHSPLQNNAMDSLRVSPQPLSISTFIFQLIESITQVFRSLYQCCCCFGTRRDEETPTSLEETLDSSISSIVSQRMPWDPLQELIGANAAEQKIYEDLIELKRMAESEDNVSVDLSGNLYVLAEFFLKEIQEYIDNNRNASFRFQTFFRINFNERSQIFQDVMGSNVPDLINQLNIISKGIEDDILRPWGPLQALNRANAAEQQIYEDLIELKRMAESNRNLPLDLNRELKNLAQDFLKKIQAYIDNNRDNSFDIQLIAMYFEETNPVFHHVKNSNIPDLISQYNKIEEDIQNLLNT